MSTLARDLRYAFRAFRKSPGFTVAAILSLAIGIGANTAIFSITSALLLRPLPYKDSDRLLILWNSSPGLGITRDWFSSAQYFDIKNNHHGFEQVALAIGGNYNLTGQGEPERVGVVRTSSNLLSILGAQPAQGRLFTPEDDRYGGPNVAIMGYGLWARRYGSDPHMVGRHIIINTHDYEVIGVLPKSFSLPREVMPTLAGSEQSDLLLPMPQIPTLTTDGAHEKSTMGDTQSRAVAVEQPRRKMNPIPAPGRKDQRNIFPRAALPPGTGRL